MGKSDMIRLTLTSILAGGHILVEDVPGVGKTMLVRTISKALGCSFKRIQFTPDLLPSDVTGTSVYNPKELNFEFRPGPIMGQIVLADEINRTSPKTQAALLEAMEERAVTVDGQTHPLPEPFFLIATQNPIEYEGTFPLPEAQLDRFMMKLSMGYPTLEEETELLSRVQHRHPIEDVKPVMHASELIEWQQKVKDIHVDESLRKYIVTISHETRNHPAVEIGVSPRGSITLFRACQAYALIEGRDYVIPDDVKKLAVPVLAHRIILHTESRLDGMTGNRVIESILSRLSVPIRRKAQ
ncbi:MAG: MoxR family ATPase [Bacillaceae bacterium]|nr:MoxR family ATPase [Bacillaceae bacterium]